jgi:hypothetical protein
VSGSKACLQSHKQISNDDPMQRGRSGEKQRMTTAHPLSQSLVNVSKDLRPSNHSSSFEGYMLRILCQYLPNGDEWEEERTRGKAGELSRSFGPSGP